jgi:molecular chaperone GrpE
MNNPTKKKIDLKRLESQVNELEQKWKRALADYQNLEKRILKEQAEFVQFANASLIDKLLSVLDILEKAVVHSQDSGVKLVLKQLNSVLESEEVAEIKAQGIKFDPQTMDCVELVKGPKNKIVAVVQKGYTLKGKIVRPAKVKVGKGD